MRDDNNENIWVVGRCYACRCYVDDYIRAGEEEGKVYGGIENRISIDVNDVRIPSRIMILGVV
jgi:hypothetical protein